MLPSTFIRLSSLIFCLEDCIKEPMGVVDAAKRGEIVFFSCVIFCVLVILGCEFNGFFLIVRDCFFVYLFDVFLEHYDVFLHPCFFIHNSSFYGSWSGEINVCIVSIFIVFQPIKCFVGWETTKWKGI